MYHKTFLTKAIAHALLNLFILTGNIFPNESTNSIIGFNQNIDCTWDTFSACLVTVFVTDIFLFIYIISS
jgi:hypothetical protein